MKYIKLSSQSMAFLLDDGYISFEDQIIKLPFILDIIHLLDNDEIRPFILLAVTKGKRVIIADHAAFAQQYKDRACFMKSRDSSGEFLLRHIPLQDLNS